MSEESVPFAAFQSIVAAIGRSFGSFDTMAGLHGRIEYSTNEEERHYEGWVLPKFQAWELRDLDHGDRSRCNTLDGLLTESDEGRKEHPSSPPRRFALPGPLQLLVPGELLIWGRPKDSWRIASIEKAGDEATLFLTGLRDETERASATLSSIGCVTRYDTPWSSTAVSAVEEIDGRPDVWWGPLSQGR